MRTHTKLALATCLCAAILSAPDAGAAEVRYVLQGTIDLNLNGMFFDDAPLTLTGYGDPAKSTSVSGNPFVPLTQLVADVPGYGVFPVTNSIYFFVDPSRSRAGFFDRDSFTDVLTFSSPAFASFDPTQQIKVSGVTFVSGKPFQTAYGQADILGASNLTFQAAAVPEPATWTLMITGFGLVGAAIRRRTAPASA